MKLNHLFSITTLLVGIGVMQSAYAVTTCTSRIESLSPNQTQLSGTINYYPNNAMFWPTPNPPQSLRGFSLVNCRNVIPDFTARTKEAWFNTGDALSNIDLSSRKSFAGTTYYKLKGTSNDFANQYGYVSFQVQESRANATVSDIQETIPFVSTGPGTGQSSTQGLYILNLMIAFERAPSTNIVIPNLRLGQLNLRLVHPDNTITQDSEFAVVSINYAPPVRPTCDVASQDVRLPTVSTSAFRNTGDEAGMTRFAVTATCPALASGQMLDARMIDNTTISNTGLILSNSNSASNIGLKIYDGSNNNPIQFNQYFNYGRLSTTTTSSILSKDFYVKYYKTNASPAVAGLVNAQATISVSYK